MPFDRPTLETLINRARSDLETRLQGVDALLRRSFERATSFMTAGLAHGLHGHLVFLSRQFLPDTTEDDGVRRWGNIVDVPPRDAAFTTGLVNFTGVGATLLPANTQFQDNAGNIFLVDASVNLVAGAVTTSVTAQESGDKNLPAATPLTIVTPVSGIDKDALVDGGGLTGGAEVEDVESQRGRILDRLRDPPSGGGPGDWRAVALTVPGVTRAWEGPQQLGAGTVVVWFATDDDISPIPTVPKVAEVQDALDDFAPVISTPVSTAPNESPLDPEISVTPDTPEVRAAIEAELEEYLLREASPKGVTLFISQINEAISIAPGEVDHVLISPAADVVVPVGDLTTLGTITWS